MRSRLPSLVLYISLTFILYIFLVTPRPFIDTQHHTALAMFISGLFSMQMGLLKTKMICWKVMSSCQGKLRRPDDCMTCVYMCVDWSGSNLANNILLDDCKVAGLANKTKWLLQYIKRHTWKSESGSWIVGKYEILITFHTKSVLCSVFLVLRLEWTLLNTDFDPQWGAFL